MRPFETELLDAIAPAGASVRVSEMASRVQESIGAVQDKLYDEMVSNGWYERRPDESGTVGPNSPWAASFWLWPSPVC